MQPPAADRRKVRGSGVIIVNLPRTLGSKFRIGFLGGNAQPGIVLVDALPSHKPPHPVFCRGCHSNGTVAQLAQAAFHQSHGVNGRQRAAILLGLFQPLLHGPDDEGMDQGIEPLQCSFVSKYHFTQFSALQYAVLYHAGKGVVDGGQ